ncbi:C40 family peptidase [Streptomyces pathocidini]|uniref:C40 family peptidase n=1 Tax=Streptomyces pathocidini TaxID=1650571 RepID=A0ABW7UWF8_9ACTN|nr:C40 family peptidase [Streptomyces pathocidini]
MSHTAHIRSHRKPRRNTNRLALRAGVAGGVLSTLAVAGGSASAAPAETPVTGSTLEMPTVTDALAGAAAKSSAATELAAQDYEYRAELDKQRDRAADTARAAAKKAKQEAERKAEAERRAKEARAEKAAAEARERASRQAERTTLTNTAAAATSSATGSVGTVLSFLEAQLGKAYVMGATGPSAYDCSGLTQAAFKTVGVDLPRVSQDQSTTGTPVSLGNLQKGDLLFWGGVGSAYHVAVYVGDGMYIDAANPSKGVVKQKLSDYPPTSATRVL